MKKRINLIILVLIIFLAAFLRFYNLGQVPPSLSWDEAAVGFNGWTISHYARDEWGNFLPLVFKSFEDDKSPVHIYLTAISVGIFGLSEFTTRLPMALFGVLNILIIFFLAKTLFENEKVGLLASLFLAISPYNLQFSRFNHEANIALFFFMFGLWLFFIGIWQKSKLLPLAFLSFGISILSYHAAKLVVPPLIILICLLYWKKILKIKREFLTGVFILAFFTLLFVINPNLLGQSRMKQTMINLDKINQTFLFQKTQNQFLGQLEYIGQRYSTHFSPNYLFISGDKNARFSTQIIGEFYYLDGFFLILGILSLFLLRSKISILLFAWALLAPLPASAFGGQSEAPHAARVLFVMGSWHIIAAYGLYGLLKFLRYRYLQISVLILCLALISYQFRIYLSYYYHDYSKRYAIEWQYGMKQIAQYVQEYNGYFRVYTTDSRSQPYIFFLYYLREPVADFISSVDYNEGPKRSSNLVLSFDKYYFGDWNVAESLPNPGFLYVLTPSEYDGLRHKDILNLKKKVYYPNGTDAFFLVSYP